MLKENLIKISNKEAFNLGIQHRKMGHSIYYNPYRNLDNTIKISELYAHYNEGWNNSNKELS